MTQFTGVSMGAGKTRTLSIASGKGGVGKTTLVANLALSLASRGNRTLILDGDLGLANVDIFFGARPSGNVHDVLMGKKSMREILCDLGQNIQLLPGGHGLPELQAMNNFQRRALLEAVADLPHDFDWMLVDTAPGLTDNVMYLNAAADETLVVITPDPASMADAFALIKILHQRHRKNRFRLVCNQVRDAADGFALYRKFQDVVTRFLDVSLDDWGSIPHDPLLRHANQQQRLILRQDARSQSARAIEALSARIHGLGRKAASDGGLEAFWNQVVGMA